MFLQVEYFVPHAPTNPGPPARFIAPHFEALDDRVRANYSGMVVSMDEAIGNLTTALKDEDMWSSTLLVLFGDNGGAVPGKATRAFTTRPFSLRVAQRPLAHAR